MPSFTVSGATTIGSKSAIGPNWGGGNTGFSATRPTDDASLLAGINSTSSANPSLYAGGVSGGSSPVGSWTIGFGFALGDNVIVLGSDPAISFNSLPAGIVVLTATLKIRVSRYTNVVRDPVPQLFLRQGTVESVDLVQVSTLANIQKTFAYGFPQDSNQTFLDLLLNGFGIRVPFTSSGSVGQQFFDAKIDGTYGTVSTSWTLPVTTGIKAGDQVTINNPLVAGVAATPNLTAVTQLKIQSVDTGGISHTLFIPAQDFILQSATQIIFYFPQFGNSTSVSIFCVGDGNQFTGSVLAGTVTTIFADNSGLYVLIPLKGTDTIYNSARDGTTTDVKIPDPTIETGFLP